MVATTNISGERIPPVGSEGDILTVVSGVPDWEAAVPALPTATAAGEFPVSSGAGTTYVAANAATARTALDAPSTSELDALVSGIAGVSLSLYTPGVERLLELVDLATVDPETMGPWTYLAGVLTAGVVGDTGLSIGTRLAVRFTTANKAYGGVYVVTDGGTVGTALTLTRATDFAASGDFVDGSAFIIEDDPKVWLYRLGVADPFVLDTDEVKLDLINPTSISSLGLIDMMGEGAPAGTSLVADGTNRLTTTSAAISAFLAALTATAARTALGAETAGAAAAALASAEAYADALAQGLDPKPSVYATEITGNVTLSGTQTVGGVSAGTGKRVLLTAQTDPAENGLWLTAAGAWTRPTDSATGALTTGAHCFTEAGDQAGAEYLLTTAGTITVGTTAQTWVPYRKMQLSASAAQALGTAAAGSTGQAADAGHIHPLQTLGTAGLLSARPAASATTLGLTYLGTDTGLVYLCITDGGSDYAWLPSLIALDGDPAGTAAICNGSDTLTRTSADVSAMLAAANDAAILAAIGAETAGAAAAVTTTSIGAVPTSRSVAGAALSSDVSAATLLAAIDAARVTTPAITGGGAPWTLSASGTGASEAANGTELVTSFANGTSSAGAGGSASMTWPSVGRAFELTMRFEETGESNTNLYGIGFLTYAAGNFYWVYRSTGVFGFWANLTGDGNTQIVSVGSGMPVDGTGWIRICIDGSRLTVWTGVGVGSTPPVYSAWTVRYDNFRSTLIDKTLPTSLSLNASNSDGHSVAGATNVKWSVVTLRNLGLGN